MTQCVQYLVYLGNDLFPPVARLDQYSFHESTPGIFNHNCVLADYPIKLPELSLSLQIQKLSSRYLYYLPIKKFL